MRNFHSVFQDFIMNRCWTILNVVSASIEMFKWYFLNMLMLQITFVDFLLLNCISGMNSTMLRCATLFINYWFPLPDSFHRGMFKLDRKYNAYLLFNSLSHFVCDGHRVHMLTQWHLLHPTPNWLVQWNHHCSRMHIPAPSLWLPGYINIAQTVLII